MDYITAWGKTLTSDEWADSTVAGTNVTPGTIRSRVKAGKPPELAITLPARRRPGYQKLDKDLKPTSPYRGVQWHKKNQKWIAQIWHKGSNRTIGYFPTQRAAAEAYNKYAQSLRGADAKLNELE